MALLSVNITVFAGTPSKYFDIEKANMIRKYQDAKKKNVDLGSPRGDDIKLKSDSFQKFAEND